MSQIAIPPPPDSPSILVGQSDPDIDALASDLMSQPQQQQQPQIQPQSQAADPDIDILANEVMGVNAMVEQPPPKGALLAAAPKKNGLVPAPKAPSIKRKSQGQQLVPPPPPMTPFQQAGKQFAGGLLKGAESAAGFTLGAAKSVPYVGQAVDPMVQQANAAQQEYARDPMGAAGAALVAVPRGIIGLAEDVGNIAINQGARAMSYDALKAMGINALPNAPLNFRGAFDAIPGVQTLKQAYPGQFGTGEASGASMLPVHSPIPINNPVARGAIQGAVGGEALGAIGSAGQQARSGNINMGQALVEGLPTAAIGAGLGTALGGAVKLGKGFKGKTPAGTKPAPQPPKTPAPESKTTNKNVVMKDGSAFSQADATGRMRDPSTPPEVKEELKQLLQAKDAEFAGAGLKQRAPAQETPAQSEPAKQPQTFPPDDASTPETAEGLPTSPLGRSSAETPVEDAPSPEPRYIPNEPEGPKRFFGDTRTYRQGASGNDVHVRFPTSLERDLVAYANRKSGKNVANHVRTEEQLMRDLGVDTWSEAWGLARDYSENLRTAASNKAREQTDSVFAPELDAPPFQRALPDASTPEPPVNQDRFIFQKNIDKSGGYVDLIDTSTNEVISSSKRTEAQAAALAAKYNDLAATSPDKLEAELRRGSKNLLDVRNVKDPVRNQIVEAGQPVPEGHTLSEPLTAVAEAKHAFDEARGRFESATDAFYKNIKEPQGTFTKRERNYSADVEALVKKVMESGGQDQLGIEVNSSRKLEPIEAPRFKRGMPAEEAYSMVENLYKDMKSREMELKAARKQVEAPFLASDLGQSVNVEHAKGPVNLRAVPKQGTELNAIAEELRGPEVQKEYVDRTISNVRKAIKTRRNPQGSVNLSKLNTRQSLTPVEKTLVEGSEKSKEISDLANSAETVRALFTLRQSFDVAREVNADLHQELIVGIGKEALSAHDINFKPEDVALLEASLQLEPWTIREGGTKDVDLSRFSNEQLNYLATRRSIRSRMAEAVKEELKLMDEEYGSLDNMPNRVKNNYTTLEQLEQSLSGYQSRGGTTEGGALGLMRNAMYDYIFKWNPAYHSLNLTDPFIVGSARVGINRILAAKYLLQTDAAVKNYVKGVPSQSPVEQLRKETAIDTKLPKGVRAGIYTKAKNKISSIQNKLPDLPSERWNFEDAFLAGVIERGDRIKYEGGGTAYAHDLATGKLAPEEQIKLYADSMNVAQEITGSGSFGLNKDTIQRIGVGAKAISLFTSQPLRQARVLSDIITKDMKVDPADATARLLAFAAATTAFGGRALLPKEADFADLSPQVRPFLRGVQDLLDNFKLFDDVPIIGRDLTDKIRYSMVPFLGGVQQNMLAGEIEKFVRAFSGQNWNDMSKAAFFWALSAFARGGGLEAAKIDKNAAAVLQGDKMINAYSNLIGAGEGRPAGSSSFKKITGQKYDVGQAIKDSTLPGVDQRIGNFIKKARRDKFDKKK